MTATTRERLSQDYYPTFPNYPLKYDVEASTTVLYGTVVALNTSGNVVPVTATTSPTNLKVLGIADETVRNTGAAGSVQVRVSWGQIHLENGESITKADIGRIAFFGDNQTVFRTSDSNKRPLGGVIRGLAQDGRVIVQLSPGLVPAINDNMGRWNDLFPNPNTVVGTASAALTYQSVRDTPFLAAFFRNDQDDNLSFSYQMPHDWVLGSTLRSHMHFIPHGTAGGDVVINGYYCFTGLNGGSTALPQLSGWTSFRVVKTLVVGDMFKEQVISLPNIVPPSWASNSAHLHIFWQRPGSSDAGDTFESNNPGPGQVAANVQLVSFDTHYLRDGRLGTLYEFGVPE